MTLEDVHWKNGRVLLAAFAIASGTPSRSHLPHVVAQGLAGQFDLSPRPGP